MIYILHTQEQSCSCCGAIENWSSLYTADELPAIGRAHKLTPATTLELGWQVHEIRLPDHTVPICSTCVSKLPTTSPDIYTSWMETLKRKATSSTPKAPQTSHLEDLA